MATAVKYLYGSEAGYQALTTKDPMAFYKTEANLYLGEWKLTNNADTKELEKLIGDLSKLDTTDKTDLVTALNEVLASGGGGSGSGVWRTF